MFFTDRWILSMYSLHSMNAAIVVTSIVSIFQFAPLAVTSISEVFVGQYNGAGRYKEIGRPVWQMLWLCFFWDPLSANVLKYHFLSEVVLIQLLNTFY